MRNDMTWARSGARAWLLCALSSGALGCAAESTPPPEYPPMPERSVAPESAERAAAPVPAAKGKPGTELAGEWVEFWALSGDADTQRYVFGADGQFEWSAAAESKDPITATFGSYTYDGSSIALTITMERPRELQCESGGCRKPVDPPRSAQLSVAECPPNEEARALDASYRCLAFGDRAFWLKSKRSEAADP